MTSHAQVLLMQERLRKELVWGESHFREFKSAFHGSVTGKRAQEAKHIAREVGDMLVAFGNADGGTLIVGVEDDGTVTGLPYVQAELEIIRRAPADARPCGHAAGGRASQSGGSAGPVRFGFRRA